MGNVLLLNDGMHPNDFVEAVLEGQRQDLIVLPVPPTVEIKQQKALLSLLKSHEGTGVAFVTSGTVGTSKVVVRPYEGVLAEARDVAKAIDIRPGTQVLITTPITHSYGFGIAMAGVLAGANVDTTFSPNVHERASIAKAYLSSNEYDVMTGVPYMFRVLLRYKSRACAERCYAGGEVVPPKLGIDWNQRHGVPILQEYGLSEVGICTFSKPKDPMRSIGSPIPHTRMTVVEDEVVVHRPGAPTSYLLEDARDHDKPIFTALGVRTGDLGYRMGNLFYLTGRAKSVLKVAGKPVVPEEVEACIRLYPGIEDVVVQGQYHEVRGEIPVAYISPQLTSEQEVDLRRFLLSQLPKYKCPYTIITMDELPRSAASGKVARRNNVFHV